MVVSVSVCPWRAALKDAQAQGDSSEKNFCVEPLIRGLVALDVRRVAIGSSSRPLTRRRAAIERRRKSLVRSAAVERAVSDLRSLLSVVPELAARTVCV